MRHEGRMLGVLEVGEHRVAIRSRVVWAKFEADGRRIEALQKALLDAQAESTRLKADIEQLGRRWWVKLGLKLRLLRVA
jgi:hypothetical protein